MFEELLLGGPQGRSIVLQTHRGTNIPNDVAIHPVPGHAVARFLRLIDRHKRWVVRKPPTGIYNCVGHVWACRRTAVYDDLDQVVLRIRADDGYRTVDWGREAPLPGDVVCYWESLDPHRNFLHVGQVLTARPRASLPPEIFVLSKWDDTSGEVVHEAQDVPASFGNARLEYWTDRPG